MVEGTESVMNEEDLVCGLYHARNCPGGFESVSALRQMFPDSFPEGKMPARRHGESEGKDINPGEEQGPF